MRSVELSLGRDPIMNNATKWQSVRGEGGGPGKYPTPFEGRGDYLPLCSSIPGSFATLISPFRNT